MRKLLQKLLRKPVSYLAEKYASRPDQTRVHESLTQLYNHIVTNPGKKGPVIRFTNKEKYIILSDQHKGAKDGSDDFAFAENNYLSALTCYNKNNFCFISLGDSEELWENSLEAVKKNNTASFEKEKVFAERDAFIKIFGNHDLYWDNDPLASFNLESIYKQKVKIYEGLILKTSIKGKELTFFLTHGHQGDLQSDGNWFSKWFVATIWAPLQIYLRLNLNTPAYDDHLKTAHNRFMYDWAAKQKNVALITGHTHQPVFVSLTLLEGLYRQLAIAKEANLKEKIEKLNEELKNRVKRGEVIPDFTAYKPTYFNTGCCCFNDGDITGIEIENGFIRLIKWEYNENKTSVRVLLDEIELECLLDKQGVLEQKNDLKEKI
ncbi:metallophosphoesterase [Rubrolithibacter danxiaensis]|uniref:metallophosphoesterase n=1 Tax=Rubrolithibacter danxiaensis TaxID=3390805 RepID=UPI003BF878F7